MTIMKYESGLNSVAVARRGGRSARGILTRCARKIEGKVGVDQIEVPSRLVPGYLARMVPKLPLDAMTVEEKLQVMETIWADLSRDGDALEPPAWHEDELRKREERIAQGLNPSLDWEQAKTELLRELNDNPNSH